MAFTLRLVFLTTFSISCLLNQCISEDSEDSSIFKIEARLMKPKEVSKMLSDLGYHAESFQFINSANKNNPVENMELIKRKHVKASEDVDELSANDGPNSEKMTNEANQPKPSIYRNIVIKNTEKSHYPETIWERINRIKEHRLFVGNGVRFGFLNNNPKTEITAESKNDFEPFNKDLNIDGEIGEKIPFDKDLNIDGEIGEKKPFDRNRLNIDGEIGQKKPFDFNTLKNGYMNSGRQKNKEIGKVIKICIGAFGLAIVGIYYCHKFYKKRFGDRTKPINVPTREEALRAVPVYDI